MTNRHTGNIPLSEKGKDVVIMKIFYKVVRILCCLDFGFYEHEPVNRRVFWKVITILQSLLMITVAFYFLSVYDDEFFYEVVLYFSYYFVIVIILISLGPKNTFCQLHRDLKSIDRVLQISSDLFQLEIKIVLYSTLLTVSCVMLYAYEYCCVAKIGCLDSTTSTIIYLWLTTSTVIVDLSCAFVFYSIYCRLKCFSSILKNEDRDNLSMQRIYQSIVDLTEMHKSALHPLFLLSIFSTIYEVMANILLAIQEIRLKNSIESRLEFLVVAVSLMNMSTLALSAEFLAIEQKKIILILLDKLVYQRDPTRQRELERFIRYVEARPLRFRVYGVIPLDAGLLGVVLNFSVTYLIVILQFIYK